MLELGANNNLEQWYTGEQLAQLSTILERFHSGLGEKIGSLTDQQLEEKHTASHPLRYAAVNELLYTRSHPELHNLIFNGRPHWIDYSVGNGLAMETTLRPAYALRFFDSGLDVTLADLQLNEVEARLRERFSPFEQFGVQPHYVQSDLRDLPKTTKPRFNLGIIGFTHFYLTEAEFDLAIAHRFAECDVLCITPITEEKSSGLVLDGIFLYRGEDGNIQNYMMESMVR